MQDDFEYDALTIRPPQRTRTRWYTRLWPACLGRGCLGRRRQRFPLYLIGYDPVGRFQRAASVGDVASVEWFINASEHHVDECDRRGRSALHYASAHNHPNVVTLLSSNDCTNINLKDDEGCTPLIKATQRDNIECVSILLRHGADPHIVDANGDAALHHAICRGNINIVSKLLEYNVDIKAKTAYGLTPYQLALFENQHAMVEFLIEKGVNPDSELTPNSGGAAAVESEQSKRKCVTFNKEENFSTDIMPSCSAVRPPRQLKSVLKESFRINRASRRLKDQISISEGTMTREPEQRKKKCVTFNNGKNDSICPTFREENKEE
ncbi:ankyrin repeat domain-containing protein 26-like [Arvicola amphibius]|uniref:ankyrin repeat domain-containing protein 26-like n=1 Tax=Arvicola amphibius TaxID=1047088 RepID=UPI0018E32081|nr:ankyrin repeat domain-containing protein 26-like [Arvicola amphibius]